ncbi:Predicted integral membrane protein [Mycobacteroides abscessus subsp. bolletii]|nr:Predicted integral membrane protein [Mycobacteroides abscessus subsp. bolletii]SHR74692.1 Predicted integral membrane protein [Mycobacteroides abscessus subsp. bolletii]SHT18007.1 Predicted integral membrane protein [Mycobacteroides abscessus subsp. bolletii]SKG04019.1 Predicted integral membrane protein [Mycobacteroides abscessus subsp. bolletii]SKG71519.1 Predicted integral membrane protein [Mycobacteroides abscessus subsp. bolletii]
MVHILSNSIVSAPRGFVFEYLSDLRHAGDWMLGVEKLEIVGAQEKGLGTVYRGSIRLGPKVLHSEVVVTGWSDGEMVATESVSGFANQSTWHLFERGEETEIIADIDYQPPGGVAGRALGYIIEPFVASGVKYSERKIRQIVEHRYHESTTM